jgi:hypothetical protein
MFVISFLFRIGRYSSAYISQEPQMIPNRPYISNTQHINITDALKSGFGFGKVRFDNL